MAQVQQETIVITISKLVKGKSDQTETAKITPDSFVASLEDIVGELIEDKSLIVEVSALDD